MQNRTKLFRFFLVSEMGSGADPPGGGGEAGAGWASEAHRDLQWDPVSRNGTHISNWDPAIEPAIYWRAGIAFSLTGHRGQRARQCQSGRFRTIQVSPKDFPPSLRQVQTAVE
jgi:hypothetical protein